MDAPRLLEISGYWSFWGEDVPETLPRDLTLPSRLRESLVLVIQGVRRCGKSTLMAQLMRRYRLNPKHCAFMNFEDPRLGHPLDHTLLDAWVAGFRSAHPRLRNAYFFLDEVQGVRGWERWLRTQLDRPRGNHFVVTGSNARLLSGELSSALTGRHLTVELFPFDLDEFRSIHPGSTLEEYLHQGGFPEPLLLEDGDRLRQQYFSDVIERDVRERVGARSAAPVRKVVQMAYESAGAELSLRRIAGVTGVAVDTVAGYLAAAEDAYLLFSVPYFAFSERKRLARNRKYYPVDTGLRRMVVTRTGADRGRLLECAVQLELRRRGLQPAYWRGRGEVDFVVTTDRGFTPIQVSWEAPTERHHRALGEFYETFPQAQEAQLVRPDTFESGALAALAPSAVAD